MIQSTDKLYSISLKPWLKVKDYNDGELNMLKAVLYEIRFMPYATDKNVGTKLSTNLAEVGTDLISRAQAINEIWDGTNYDIYTREVKEILEQLPSAQPTFDARDTQYNLPIGTDCISRQAAISAICNACGKIDCDKINKCEKLQLPPANNSEIPNSSDTISRQAAIDAADDMVEPQESEG